MPAYVIANVDVHDPEAYQEYAAGVPETIARHGGRYLARGGAVEALEGDWEAHRLVILEFGSVEQAKGWYASDDYQAVAAIRHRTASTRIIVVEGVSEPSR